MPTSQCDARLFQSARSRTLALLLLLRVSQSQIAQSPVRQFERAAPDPHVDAVVEKQHVLRLLDLFRILQRGEWFANPPPRRPLGGPAQFLETGRDDVELGESRRRVELLGEPRGIESFPLARLG